MKKNLLFVIFIIFTALLVPSFVFAKDPPPNNSTYCKCHIEIAIIEKNYFIFVPLGQDFSFMSLKNNYSGWSDCKNLQEKIKNTSGYGIKSATCETKVCSFGALDPTAKAAWDENGYVFMQLIYKDQGIDDTYVTGIDCLNYDDVVKWTDGGGTKASPLIVKDMEETTAAITADISIKNVTFSYLPTGLSSITLTDEGGGKAKLVFGADVVSKSTCKINKGCFLDIVLKNDTSGTKFTRDFHFQFVPNCEKRITATDKCDDAVNQETCQKKCSSDFCEYKEKKCVEKVADSGTAGATAPSAPSGASMADKYGNAYFEALNPVPTNPDGSKYAGALPPCAFSGTCRDTNDLVQLIINFGRGMFAIMGSFAFAFFVYGGFTIILSMGNAEKVNKGKQILTAAVIGLVVAFAAYMMIDFMLDALNVDPTFRGIK